MLLNGLTTTLLESLNKDDMMGQRLYLGRKGRSGISTETALKFQHPSQRPAFDSALTYGSSRRSFALPRPIQTMMMTERAVCAPQNGQVAVFARLPVVDTPIVRSMHPFFPR